MAVYIWLASRSQVKIFKTKEIETSSGFRAQPHLHRAWHPLICHFDSCLARVRLFTRRALNQWPFQACFRSGKEVSSGCLPASSVGPRVEWFLMLYLAKKLLYSEFHVKLFLLVKFGKMVESCDQSSSQETQLKFPGCSHFRWRSDNHQHCQQCCLNDGLTLCTKDSMWHMKSLAPREFGSLWQGCEIQTETQGGGCHKEGPWFYGRFHRNTRSWGRTSSPTRQEEGRRVDPTEGQLCEEGQVIHLIQASPWCWQDSVVKCVGSG